MEIQYLEINQYGQIFFIEVKMERTTNEGDLVVDPFMGSGTTNRNFIR